MAKQANSLTAISILIMAVLATLAGGQRFGKADEPSGQSADADRIRTLVRDEVARQLPEAVATEVKKQMDELIRQAQVRNRTPLSMSMLNTIRSQIMLYKLQHNDKAPALEQLQDNWSALVNQTDADGKSGPQAEFGPYLQKPPLNPYNGSGTVTAIGRSTTSTGWVYSAATGQLKIVIPSQFRNQFTDRDAEVPTAGASIEIGK